MQLSKSIEANHRSYSIQAIYHVLRKLRRNGIVVKVGDQFNISLTWALDIIDLAKSLEARVVSALSAGQAVPTEGQTMSVSFTSLLTLDEFWTHLMVLLVEQSSERAIYNFCPHPWFYFVHQKHLDKFYRTLTRRRYRIFVLLGADNFLDRYFVAHTDSSLYSCAYGSGAHVSGSQSQHVMVIGDFIIRVSLNRKIAGVIDACFKSIRSAELREIRRLQSALDQSVRVRMRITKSVSQAEALRIRFTDIFG